MKNKLLYIISFFVFVVDLVSKLFIISNFDYNSSVTIINKFFYINFVKNEGGAFSILSGNVIFIIIVTLIVFIFIYNYVRNRDLKLLEKVGYGLIMGGAFGNLFDRVIYGYVIDFFDIYIFGYDFPVFNIADSGIVIGVIILIISEVSGKNEDKSRRKIKNR
ncbi:MAG: signal peptidase II [Bacilli bacterium]|nr:signal peptidase II [Bacilli bacterium]